jgi:type I restriction enzyme R subunit
MPAGCAQRCALPVSHAPAARLSEKLQKTLNAYHNRAISPMQVIEELIKLAKDLDAATKRGENLGLTDDEDAFYDPHCLPTSARAA